MAKQDDYLKTAIRLPRELHALILDAAKQSGQSINSEMIIRIQQSFGEKNDSPLLLSMAKQIEVLTGKIEALVNELASKK